MGPLWKHQIKSIEAAAKHKAFGIFSGMGSGKSRIAIEIVKREGHKRILILCPKRAMDDGVWENQLRLYYGSINHISIRLDSGTSLYKATLLKKLKFESPNLPVFVIVNYDSAWRKPLGDEMLSFAWDCIIADEAHRLKAAGSSISKWAGRLGKLPSLKKKLALTGTPTPNSPLDVYGLYRFLDSTIFGTNYAVFSNKYATFGGFHGYQVLWYRDLNILRAKMESISIRFETKDVIDLPPVQDTYHWTEFTPENQQLYDTFKKEFVAEIQGHVISAVNVLTKTLRLQQLCGGWVKVDKQEGVTSVGTEKKLLLQDMLEELPTGFSQKGITREPLVLFYQFTADSLSIANALKEKGFTYGLLSGRYNDLPKWRNGECDALIVQVQSGSESIDLTRASYCFFYSSPWSLGIYDQARGRVHRPGQTKPTHFIHLGVRGTIDQDIQYALTKKLKVNDYLMSIYSGEKDDYSNMHEVPQGENTQS